MPEMNWNADRELLKLSDLPDQAVSDAAVVLAAAATNSMLLRSRKIGGVTQVAQFLLDEGQRRLVRKHKTRVKL